MGITAYSGLSASAPLPPPPPPPHTHFETSQINIYAPIKLEKSYEKCFVYFWFHTAHIDPDTMRWSIPRQELDNGHHHENWSAMSQDLEVELIFAPDPTATTGAGAGSETFNPL